MPPKSPSRPRLCNRNNIWSRTTRVDALHSAGSRKITEYEPARQAPLEESRKRKKEEDTIPQPTKRGKSGQSSVSEERRMKATNEPNQPQAALEQGSGVAVSSPLFNHQNIRPLDAPDMTIIVKSSTVTEHNMETDIYDPITRHNEPERRLYQFLEDLLLQNQSLIGIARFASRRKGCPTRAVSCVMGESDEKLYRIGAEDSDESYAGNDLLQEVTSNLDLSKHVTLASHSPPRASSVQPKPVIRRIETVQETVTLGVTLFEIYEKHSILGLVKAILGALYGGTVRGMLRSIMNVAKNVFIGYRNLLRSGWLHRDISVNNIVVGSNRDFEPSDYDQHGGCAVPTAYDSDCLIEDEDGKLCGMLIDFDLAVQRRPKGGTANEDEAFPTGTLNFMATAIFTAHERIAWGREIPSAHSPSHLMRIS
ncbi:hypothetical protein L202_04315 [Cryptococcus amylolentus CBS 6039]|uniref:Fungal-type protein kinase domain-containing protein n=1 Tax=Cryptococcus amylolentus CBS 6039 TaxID=1295533 RepID=A0A1E3HQV7_9TREE|nr:hypothetical protein L202_04315 [Cryptococcus amylolentus CBS 6039]ODN78753.1 hypothetical protein L202_04315 [Cryptococcus amylolentus CBS 6039]